MKTFVSKFWDWLFKRSPCNALNPNVQGNPSDPATEATWGPRDYPIETNILRQPIAGSVTELVTVETAARTSDGQLVTQRIPLALSLGCGHIVSQMQAEDREGKHIRGIAGPCAFCAKELQEAVCAGKIDVKSADRQKAFDVGIDDFLAKPFSEEDLRESIEKHMKVY